jgi:MFS family permease
MWQGQIGASASQWMEQIARPFLILELTDSYFLVGLIAATRMVPMLLVGIWAGVIADRMDKKKILVACQAVTFGAHAVTAILILTSLIDPIAVFAGTFVTGCAQAFNQPARQSLIPRLVPREHMANALALNSAAFNTMRTGGPAIAGAVLAVAGFEGVYVMQTLVYVWVIWSTSRIHEHGEPVNRVRASMRTELVEGFAAVKRDRIIFYIMVLCLALFVLPFQGVFIPLIAVESLDMSKETAGILLSAVGFGALLGALVVATIGDTVRNRGMLMITMLVLFAFALLVFARGETLLTAIPALLVCGAMQTSFMSLNNAFVLGRTPPELHGRVLSLFSLDRGLVPLGATLAGALSASLGAADALTIMAGCFLLGTVLIAALVPSLRHIH